MRGPIAVLTLVLVLGSRALAPCEEPSGDAAARNLQEIRKLQARIDTLERRLDALESAGRSVQASEPGDDPDALPSLPSGIFGGKRRADRAALAKIRLPKNPTRDDVELYVDKIVAACAGQDIYASTDPQIAMLAKVGREHLDVLISRWSPQLQSYFAPAVSRLATDQDKALIISSLADCRELVVVVRGRGWARDAKEELVAGLRSAARGWDAATVYLPTEWIQAVASLEDPETYPDLVEYLVQGMNPRHTYDAIRGLSGIDLDKAVSRAWDRATRPNARMSGLGREDLAPIAACHGIREALDQSFEALEGAVSDWERQELRQAILEATEARGTAAQMLEWYRSRKDALRWDPTRRKFVVPREA